MKRLIILLMIMVGVLFLPTYSTFAQGQAATDGTMSKSTPGLYVCGWPSFTLSYPENWVESTPQFQQIFRAVSPDTNEPHQLTISVFSSLMPLENTAMMVVPLFERIGQDVKVLYEKPSQLKDGTPAFEVELEWINPSGNKENILFFSTKKEEVWILSTVDSKGKIGEDLKAIVYSMKIKPGPEELVKVPDDVREFLQGYAETLVENDLEKAMTYFCDRYLQYGRKKQDIEARLQSVLMAITSMEPNVTGFKIQGDKACLSGFWSGNFGKVSMEGAGSFIIKENGKWKWYGNQK